MQPRVVLLTGAAGKIGPMLRPRLKKPGRTMRLLDIEPIHELLEGEEFVHASVTERPAMYRACHGVDAIIHLGAIHTETDWDPILDVNIDGTRTVFEAARQAGVKRVIFASSNHAVGYFPLSAGFAPDYLFPMPDTFYGISKVAGEAIASMYSHRYGIDATCIRIMTCRAEPVTKRMLATWFSPDDAGRAFEACLTTDDTGFHIIWGVSANTRAWFSTDEGRKLGFVAADNAEAYADKLANLPEDYNDRTYIGAHLLLPERDTTEDFSGE